MSKFVKMDEQLLATDKLSSSEKLVIMFVISWAYNHNWKYEEGYQYLADKLGFTKRGLIKIIQGLENKRIIAVDRTSKKALITINQNNLLEAITKKRLKNSLIVELFEQVYHKIK